MKLFSACKALITAWFVFCLTLAHAAPPLEAYGKLPSVEEFVISPSGDRYATVTALKGRRYILVIDQNGKTLNVLPADGIKIRSLDFVTDDLILMQQSTTEDLGFGFAQNQIELFQAFVIPVAGGRPELVFGNERTLMPAIFGNYGVRNVDGQAKAYFGAVELERASASRTRYEIAHGRPALYEVDLASNKTRRVEAAAPPGRDREWLVGADGKVVARFEISDEGNWQITNSSSGILVSGENTLGRAALIAVGPDGRSIIYSQRGATDGVQRWFTIPFDKSTEPVEFLPGEDVRRIYLDRASGHMIGYFGGRGDSRSVFFDEASATKARNIKQAFAGLNSTLMDWTANLGKVVVRTDGNGDSGTFYIVDLTAGKADAVAYERDAIGPNEMGAISRVDYAASDGLKMDGILTLPPSSSGKNLPLVMLPHGGPTAHDIVAFDWWAQAFASRGYAVFQPNFRGSTGRDQAFIEAGNGEWGRKMQSDISDGIAHLAQQGIVDADRVCIMGASYGGYAALAGVTLQDGIYQCAVSVNGVADVALLSRIERRESGYSRMLTRSLEEQLGPRSGYQEISPYHQATKANAPILLIHGEDDTVVPYQQSKRMADALMQAGKPFEFVTLEGEDHWLSQEATRMAMLKAAMDFVLEHNPPS